MATVFEDMFDVKSVNPDGKKFDKVSRIQCTSEEYDMDLLLDIHAELLELEEGDKFTLALATTLALETQGQDDGTFDQSGKPSLMDHYDYVMHGLIYSFKTASRATSVKVYASFGGLLMELKGDQRNMEGLTVDSPIYLLIRKMELI